MKLKFDEAYNKLKGIYMMHQIKKQEEPNIFHTKKRILGLSYKLLLRVRAKAFSRRFLKKVYLLAQRQMTNVMFLFPTTFENLLGMANGKLSSEKLFISGRLKVKGNMSKAAALRYMLGTKDISESL